MSVVTGGAGGLGLAFCELLVAAGGKVALVDVNADALASAKAHLEGLYPDAEVIAERVDIADHAQVKAFRDLVLQRWGKVQHVVNNAGVTDKHDAWDFEGPGMDEFKKVVDVNLWGTVYMTNAFIKVRRGVESLPDEKREAHAASGSLLGVHYFREGGLSGRRHRPSALLRYAPHETESPNPNLFPTVCCLEVETKCEKEQKRAEKTAAGEAGEARRALCGPSRAPGSAS